MKRALNSQISAHCWALLHGELEGELAMLERSLRDGTVTVNQRQKFLNLGLLHQHLHVLFFFSPSEQSVKRANMIEMLYHADLSGLHSQS